MINIASVGDEIEQLWKRIGTARLAFQPLTWEAARPAPRLGRAFAVEARTIPSPEPGPTLEILLRGVPPLRSAYAIGQLVIVVGVTVLLAWLASGSASPVGLVAAASVVLVGWGMVAPGKVNPRLREIAEEHARREQQSKIEHEVALAAERRRQQELWEAEAKVRQSHKQAAAARLAQAQSSMETLQAESRRDHVNYDSGYRSQQQRAALAHSRYERRGEEERQMMAVLRAQMQTNQRQTYLRRFSIGQARRLDGFGPEIIARLRAFGIESVADIHRSRIERVRGIGAHRSQQLVNLRATMEAGFRFNPNQPIQEAEMQQVRQKQAEVLRATAETLRGALAAILSSNNAYERRLTAGKMQFERMQTELRQAMEAYAQAEVDEAILTARLDPVVN